MPPTTSPPPPSTIAPHLHPYQVHLITYLTTNNPNKIPTSHLVASAAVINSSSSSKRILLLQRTAHSFQPLRWELPGGRCESHDSSLIASAIRELWEESGLVAKNVLDVVGEYEWVDRGKVWRKVTFLVEVEGDGDGELKVVVDPREQEGFVWATEEEVVVGRCGGVVLRWTSEEQKEVVLKAFGLV